MTFVPETLKGFIKIFKTPYFLFINVSGNKKTVKLLVFNNIFVDYTITVVPFPPLHPTLPWPPPASQLPPL